ncbi:MAG: hypothetical protein DYG89_20405 [Caldilinea sp. CFX5]|nr:hypothetical protein [Caldilinea sp. CFX5]
MNTIPVPVVNADWQLTALPQATNLTTLNRLVAPMFLSAFPESRCQLTAATAFDGKAGERVVIRYDLAATTPAATGGPITLFGKLYANPARAAQVYTAMSWLWGEVFRQAPEVGVPRPLGLLPDLGIVFYVPVEGQFLNELFTHEQADHWMALTATWLGQLHQQPLQTTKHFDLANELTNLKEWARLIGQSYPTLFDGANHLVAYLRETAPRLSFQVQAPIHKDFHYQHVLVNGRLAVIDFDEMRLGDPNFDLAHFCANLHLLAHRTPQQAPRLQQLEQTFLQSYSRQTGWTADQRFLYFFIYTCVKLAKQLCTQRGPHPRPTGAEQQRQVEMILAEGIERTKNSYWKIINT